MKSRTTGRGGRGVVGGGVVGGGARRAAEAAPGRGGVPVAAGAALVAGQGEPRVDATGAWRRAGRIVAAAALLAALLPGGPLAGPGAARAHQMAGDTAAPATKAQLFEGLGDFHFPVSTKSKTAQRWFDQGLILFYGFNLDEAALSFREATRVDPTCAMAWWGVALANGPHVNNPAMDPPHAEAAHTAILKARSLAAGVTPRERDYIEALATRYAFPLPADTAPLYRAYAEALRGLMKKHPKDADARALFAEAMMDMAPFDFWNHDGTPKNGGDEVVAALEAGLAVAPQHPGLNHFYIHAVEGSKHPEKAIHAAEILDRMAPAAGHLVHMPAHIFMRTGRYEEASAANRAAIKADDTYLKQNPDQGSYMMYVAHNFQFLAASAMMEGRSAEALEAALTMRATMPAPVVQEMAPMLDGYMALPLHVMVRFGLWDKLLAEPRPPAYQPLTTALWRYGRAMALVGTHRPGDAAAEADSFDAAAARVPAGFAMGFSPAPSVLGVARELLLGRMAAASGRLDDALRHLQAGAALEDSLHYDEPPDWMPPVRHYLGATLLAAGRPADAAAVFREDLARNPENGWSLFGLAQALDAAGPATAAEAAATRARFEKAWARADVRLGGAAY